MEYLTHAVVTLLTTYLALTNTLADRIIAILPSTLPETVIRTEIASERIETTLPTLPSSLGIFLTDVLKKSSAYQRAAVMESAVPPAQRLLDPSVAVVNIVCTFTTDSYIRTTTGTGFFIDSAGIILTNAHVAQYLLIAETTALGDASCIVRSDDLATPQYVAELLYIPPTWIQANADRIVQKVPMGTGERDYALLYVTGTRGRAPLPVVFPALTVNTDFLSHDIKETAVTAIGYPVLTTSEAGAELALALATTTVSELYTFGSNYADVFSIRGSAVGAGGSSGGPVLANDGSVIGMITTRGNDVVDGPGSLRAITLSHISRTIEEETGVSLERNISGDIPIRAKIFERTMVPFLLTFLTTKLEAGTD